VVGLAVLVVAVLVLVGVAVSRGGSQRAVLPGGSTTGGSTVEEPDEGEVLEDASFVLNTSQPVPTDLRAAYERRTLIVVGFFKQGQDDFYPQGLEVDDIVRGALVSLEPEYPQVEFFLYDIDNPGTAETSEGLEPGQYGTLAAQLDVGYTPYVAMLAPDLEGDDYRIENLFRGYADQGVLDQALYDLTNNAASQANDPNDQESN
jgi:hypothetical protein